MARVSDLGLGVILVVSSVGVVGGCGDPGGDEADAGGDDDDGDDDAGEPNEEPDDLIDPPEGESPPGSPSESKLWTSPWTLGNALVHDARPGTGLNQAGEVSIDAAALTSGVTWDAIGSSDHAAMRAIGFRPQQLDATVFIGPDVPGGIERVALRDDSAWVADYDSNYLIDTRLVPFRSLQAEQEFVATPPTGTGWRPMLVQAHTVRPRTALATDFSAALSVTWVRDGALGSDDWRLRTGLTTAELTSVHATLVGEGFRPLSVSPRAAGANPRYAALYVRDAVEIGDWDMSASISGTAALQTDVDAKWQAGLYPASLAAVSLDGTRRYTVLYARRPPLTSFQSRTGMSDDELEARDSELRSQGYHLVSSTHAGPDYTAVWVRSLPYLRWTGTECDDTECQARYLGFAEPIVPRMIDGGTRTRPSAVITVLAGGAVAFQRAYTYAPAYYADTPVDAKLHLASSSKSLTALAVVDLMDEAGLSLDTPFADAIGWSSVPGFSAPPEFLGVTVRDVLRHFGGFGFGGDTYNDHEDMRLDVTMALGSDPGLPVSLWNFAEMVRVRFGQDAFMDAPAMWDVDGVTSGTWIYSNVGYSLLGALVEHLTGTSYDQAITSRYASVPGWGGLRASSDARYVPTYVTVLLARLGGHLTDPSHPYRLPPTLEPIHGEGELWLAEPQSAPHVTPNVRPDTEGPARTHTFTYGGRRPLGGVSLPAGGWRASSEDLARAIRASFDGTALPLPIASAIWDDASVVAQGALAGLGGQVSFDYGLGWYVRRKWKNWLATAGSANGVWAYAFYNRSHDLAVAVQFNANDGAGDYLTGVFGGTWLDMQYPCLEDPWVPVNSCEGDISPIEQRPAPR